MSSQATSTAEGPEKARIVIADDHDLVRSGLRSMISQEPDLKVVGEAEDGLEAVRLCERLCPDLVLMDMRMPRVDGIEATRALKRACPLTSVLMVTIYENPDCMFEALKAGAAGYILKDSTQQEMLCTVRGVLSGESPLDPRLASQLLRRLADETQEEEASVLNKEDLARQPERREEEAPLPEPLTNREKEALRLMARGQTNKEIAQDMIVSEGTAKLHVRRILSKLRVSDRTQAVVRAIELGLLMSLLPPPG